MDTFLFKYGHGLSDAERMDEACYLHLDVVAFKSATFLDDVVCKRQQCRKYISSYITGKCIFEQHYVNKKSRCGKDAYGNG